MSELVSAKTRIEVFCSPVLWSDHFQEAGWVASPSGQAAFDGQRVTLTVKAGESNQHFSKAVSFDSVVHRFFVVRVLDCNCEWRLHVQRASDGVWVLVGSGSSVGEKVYDINAVFSGNVMGVDLVASGVAGQSVSFDYVAVCKYLELVDEGAVSGELRVALRELKRGVNSASVKLASFGENDPSCVLQLKFDEGCGLRAVDTGKFGNHGVISGASWVDGKVGKALNFNGVNDIVTVSDAAGIHEIGASSFSVEFWLKSSTGNRDILYKVGAGKGFAIWRDSGNITCRIYSPAVIDIIDIYGTNIPLDGNWYYCVFVFDKVANFARWYINVNADSAVDISAVGDISNIGALKIGEVYAYARFLGVLDEVRFHSRVLGLDEIKRRFVDQWFDVWRYGRIRGDDRIIVWCSRDGGALENPDSKLFGGKVISALDEGVAKNCNVVSLECQGYGEELDASPALLRKGYAGVNGRLIVEEALALCAYLRRHPATTAWFDREGPYGTYDDRVGSVHTVGFDEVVPYGVFKDVLESAQNPAGAVGFDVYESAEGCLVGHAKNSTDFVSSVVPVLRKYKQKVDVYPVKNRVKVYGVKGRFEPVDADGWTENTVDGWVADFGTLSVVTDANAKMGTKVLKCTVPAAGYVMSFRRPLLDVVGVGKGAYAQFQFWGWFDPYTYLYEWPVTREFRLRTDASNYFYISSEQFPVFAYPNAPPAAAFVLPFGPQNEYSAANPEGVWRKVGNPDWLRLVDVQYYFVYSVVGVGKPFYLDAAHFSGGAFRGEAADGGFSGLGRVICAEPVSDAGLLSDGDCVLKAQSLLAQLKDPVELLDGVVVDGDVRFRAGDLVPLRGVHRRLLEVVHRVRGGGVWDAELVV